MKRYKGLYIDNAIFHSKADIDDFLKRSGIEAYKVAVEVYCIRRTLEAAKYVDERAEYLVNQCGMDWEELEEIEIATMKGVAV